METKTKNLIFCLVAEIAILIIGLEFFNPFPIKEIREDQLMVLITLILYGLSCACGIFASIKSGLLQDNTHMTELLFLCLFIAFLAPMWPIILGCIIIYTIVLLLLQNRKSSES